MKLTKQRDRIELVLWLIAGELIGLAWIVL